MKQEAKISVIVPVYGVERYISDCIRSLCDQTWKNLEILLIDDGSKDGSGKICDEWAKKDSRIRVFHVENGGQSRARNIGMKNSRSLVPAWRSFFLWHYGSSKVFGIPIWQESFLFIK